MASKHRGASRITNASIWRMILMVLCGVFAVLTAVVWFSGGGETQDALDQGRRLLIRLDTGAIEGHQETQETPESAQGETPAATPDKDSAAATAAPAATPAQETYGPNPEGAAAPVDTNTVKTAAVPLADIRENLSEKSETGPLPVIGPDAVKPWHYYAKPYMHKGNLPMIAVVVTGLGQNKAATDAALRLQENFSLSFSPYAKDLTSWTKAARVAGHEVIIDLPLEPSNYPASDPGPYALLAGKGKQENINRLNWLMSRTEGYIGFTTPQNEVFSANGDAFKSLLETLSNRGLMLFAGHDPASDETKQILSTNHTANVVGDVLLDEELSAAAIQTRLALLETTAKKRGYAVGVAQAFPLTMQQLNTWSAQLQKDGFVLVPISFIASLKFAS